MRNKVLIVAIVATVVLAGVTTAYATSSSPQTTTVEAGSGGTDAPVVWEPLEEYGKFGVSYNEKGEMLFDGQLVWYFGDGYELEPGMRATRYDYFNEDGMVDVHTVRGVIDNGDGSIDPCGEPLKIVAYSQQEFAQRDIEAIKTASSGPVATSAEGLDNTGGRTFAEIFQAYGDWGVTFVPVDSPGGVGNLFYNGRPVKTFIDEKPDGGVFAYQSPDGGEIVVRTVYENNELVGVAVQ